MPGITGQVLFAHNAIAKNRTAASSSEQPIAARPGDGPEDPDRKKTINRAFYRIYEHMRSFPSRFCGMTNHPLLQGYYSVRSKLPGLSNIDHTSFLY